MSTPTIHSSSRDPILPLRDTDAEKEKNKNHKADLARTLNFIEAHKYRLTKNVKSRHFTFSFINDVINNAKYEKGFYDNQQKRWCFSFCGTTSEGDSLRMIVSPESHGVSIHHVTYVRKFSEEQI